MPETNNTMENLRQWFRTCPAISDKNRFSVDYLAEDATEYSLISVPTPLKYRENILGEEVPEKIQELEYIFTSRQAYGADVPQNLKNLAFYGQVTNWILEQNAKRNFPEIAEGKVLSIVPTLTPFAAQVGSDTAKYQIQIKLKYRRNA